MRQPILLSAKSLLPIFLFAALTSSALDGPLTPEQAMASFRLDPGLKIECVASEPDVVSPVAVAWDEQGRMFVVENRGYPVGPGKGLPPAGQVVMFEDTNGDGKYDKRTVFADKLTFPNGVMPWKGGVYVTCAPNLYYFKDTDGDGIADVKEIVLKGFQDLSTTQLRVSHPTLNIDNFVYLTSGLTSAKLKSPKHPEFPEVYLNRTDGRFNPLTEQIEPTAGMAQFGQSFDDFGHKFICMNREHIQHVLMQNKYLKRNPDFAFSDVAQSIPDHGAACRVYAKSANITTAASHTGFFTSACAVTLYRGTALPSEYEHNSFTCEPAGNLVHRDVLSNSNETFVASRAADGVEFLASPDNWCRPVNLAVGPDGALYVCDMYRKTIEHPDYLPEATRKITDFQSGKDKGRLYRISSATPTSAQNKSMGRKPNFAKMSVKEICNEFNNPNAWWRVTAQRILLERQDKAAVPILKSMVKNGKTPQARVHALRMLEGLNALADAEIQLALADKDANVREQGIQVAEVRLPKSAKLLSRVIELAGDPDARVRFQCALSLGEVSDDPKTIPALAKIAQRDMGDKWARAAVLTSVGHEADKLLHLLLASNTDQEGSAAMFVDLCKIVGVSEPRENIMTLLSEVTRSILPKDAGWQIASVNGIAEGLRSRTNPMSFASLLVGDSGAVMQLNLRIARLFKVAAEAAQDSKLPLSQRVVAVNFLGQSDYATSGATLAKLLEPTQASELQTAAVRALGQMNDVAALNTLVTREHWSSFTPSIRDAAVTAIVGRSNQVELLFTAIEKGDVQAWTINGDKRNQLMHSKDDKIKERATALFKDMNAGDRMKVYEEFKAVLSLHRNPANGHAMFQRTCTPCHTFAGEGKTVGPDLTGIRNQPDDVLLLHIMVPEFEIMPTYTLYNVETKDGNSISGLLATDTPTTITLRQAGGIEEQVPRAKIATMASSRLSLMPQELEKTMTKQELADLIGFLKGETSTTK
ncbi:MAG: putative rane-bound dehydrogenase [Verrucomicrobiales bacterium]|nr:putative rane-bound dehydrogenase [Verrucomicrobiales bacterium]